MKQWKEGLASRVYDRGGGKPNTKDMDMKRGKICERDKFIYQEKQ